MQYMHNANTWTLTQSFHSAEWATKLSDSSRQHYERDCSPLYAADDCTNGTTVNELRTAGETSSVTDCLLPAKRATRWQKARRGKRASDCACEGGNELLVRKRV